MRIFADWLWELSGSGMMLQEACSPHPLQRVSARWSNSPGLDCVDAQAGEDAWSAILVSLIGSSSVREVRVGKSIALTKGVSQISPSVADILALVEDTGSAALVGSGQHTFPLRIAALSTVATGIPRK